MFLALWLFPSRCIYGLLTKCEVDIGQVLSLYVYGVRRSGLYKIMCKKSTRPISSHLDRASLVNKQFIIWVKTLKHDKFSLWDKTRIPRRQDSSILLTWVANDSMIPPCPLTELVKIKMGTGQLNAGQ